MDKTKLTEIIDKTKLTEILDQFSDEKLDLFLAYLRMLAANETHSKEAPNQ